MDDIDVDNMEYELPDHGTGHAASNEVRYVETDELFKRWVCLYPLYFDARRSLEQGRKVPQKLAYPQPDPRAIIDAAKQLRFMVAYEPHKMHPRDFGTTGRVRIQLKVDGQPVRPDIPNRKVLMQRIGALLPDIQPSLPPAPSNVPPEWAALTQAFSGAPPGGAEQPAAITESGETGGKKSKKGKKGRR